MKMMYRINDLIDNVNTVFPSMPEYQTEEWYQQIARHFDDVLECDYWHRIINKLVEKDDFISLLNFVQKKIKLYLYTNEYKVSNLYDTTQFEYNPLWNVDGTETRELSREITGEDTDTFNETNTLARTGSDTTSNSGYNELVKSGNDTTTNSGYTELVKTGNDSTSNSGYDEVVKSGSNTVTTSKTTMNSSTFYDTEKTVEQPNLTERTNLNSTNQTTHNTTDRNNVNTSSQTAYNTTDRNNLNSSEQTSYNSTNTDSHTGTVSNEKSNTETLTETTTRQGNIGVTKTTELIESQRQIVNFNFINYICHEIVNEFTILVD